MIDWSPEPPQEDPGPECGERLPPRSRPARDAPGRHLLPLHHPGPLPLHRVAAPGLPSLYPPLRCAANTSSQLKGPWLVSESYTCADVDYLTCFLKEGYYLLEYGEIRSAEIINCGGRKNDYIDMTL